MSEKDALYRLIYTARMNIKYHSKMAWLMSMAGYLHQALMGLLCAMAFGFLASGQIDGASAVLLFTLLLSLIPSPFEHAGRFKLMRYRWLQLRIACGAPDGSDLPDGAISALRREKLDIEKYEGAAWRWLLRRCQREVNEEYGVTRRKQA